MSKEDCELMITALYAYREGCYDSEFDHVTKLIEHMKTTKKHMEIWERNPNWMMRNKYGD